MIFTIEALYALHMLNDYSDDLLFLPLPSEDEKTRLENLRTVLLKGYADLEKLGLMIENEPTEDCVQYGLFLKLYHKAFYHCQVDADYCCASAVDSNKWYSVVIKKVEGDGYVIEHLHSLLFLSLLQQGHPILKNLDKKEKAAATYTWTPYSHFRLMTYYSQSEAIRMTTFSNRELLEDRLFIDSPSGLYEFDRQREQIRSINGAYLKSHLIRGLKVRV